MSLEIYREQILEHYNNPINYGTLKNPDVISKDYNPSCGDVVEIQIKFDRNKIQKIKFHGQGCAISQSSTDILIDSVKNKTIEDITKMDKEDLLSLIGVKLSPLRLKCAFLGLKTLKMAIYTFLESKQV